MSESKKLSEKRLEHLREVRRLNRFITTDHVSLVETTVSLLDHIDAREAEYQAGMLKVIDDAFRQGAATTAFINQQAEKMELIIAFNEDLKALSLKDSERIDQLIDALKDAQARLDLEGIEYEALNEVLKANDPE